MMTNPKPPARINPIERPDPYRMRTLEQILTLFDGGRFLEKLMQDHRQLQQDLLEHQAEHGGKVSGSMTLSVAYALGKTGDVGMTATATFKTPKKPPSSAAAYISDNGDLTLYSPLMARMQPGVRDVPDHDPETGEVRDV